MSKSVKIWLAAAAILILLGGIIFLSVMFFLKWDFGKLSTSKYETNNYEISEDFRSIAIDTDTADIKFVASEDSECRVTCYEQKNMKHEVLVEDNILNIKVNDTRKWYEYIGINFRSPKITVFLPKGEYGTLTVDSETGNVEIPKDLVFESMDITESTGKVVNRASVSGKVKIKTSTGNIRIEDISAGSLELSVSTGKVSVLRVACADNINIKVSTGDTVLENVECKSLVSKGSTGDISLTKVVASKDFSIERSTGNVKFKASDAAEITVKTDTGNVKGDLLSSKIFVTKTDTGSVNVPETTTGGKCKITTDTGNIKITMTES